MSKVNTETKPLHPSLERLKQATEGIVYEVDPKTGVGNIDKLVNDLKEQMPPPMGDSDKEDTNEHE